MIIAIIIIIIVIIVILFIFVTIMITTSKTGYIYVNEREGDETVRLQGAEVVKVDVF